MIEQHGPTERHGLAARAGRWSARNPGRAVAIWIAFVLVATMAGGVGLEKLSKAEDLDGESAAAQRALDRADFGDRAAEQVLLQAAPGQEILSAAGRAAIHDAIEAIESTGRVEHVRSPFAPGNSGQLTKDRRAAVVLFDMKGDPDTAFERVEPVLDAVAAVARTYPDLRVEQFGAASAGKTLDDTIGKDLRRAETISIPLTFGVLLVVFGALLAAFMPLLLALSVVAASSALLAVVSHAVHASDSSSTILLLVGLAVGVDYSLFYIRREREERVNGRSSRDALDIAAATSGRSVLISGITVIIAMSGMFLTGQGTFVSMATATIVVVGVAVIGSLTVLPATLSLLGDRIQKGRVPWFGTWLQRRRDSGASRLWSSIAAFVLRRPRTSSLAAAGLLVAMAIPAVSLHTAQLSATQELPADLPIMQTYQRFQDVFPGGAAPATVVVAAKNVASPKISTQIAALREQAVASGRMFEPITVDTSRDGSTARLTVPLAGNGQNAASRDAVELLRERLVPDTVGRVGSVNVGGATASSMDFNARLAQRSPWVIAFVLTLAFLLLLWSFRSLVIATTGVILNLLSVGAAYGVLVAVFQWGWGKSLLGLSGTGAIASWLPLFLFVILLGLSMDYHVFSVSRIKEGHDRGLSTNDAIRDGISRSAGVITSAAFIMVLVFLTFATLQMTSMKQLGVGLAVAVLVDATIVRAVLLPATMAWLGDRNWYLPRRLSWIARGSEQEVLA